MNSLPPPKQLAWLLVQSPELRTAAEVTIVTRIERTARPLASRRYCSASQYLYGIELLKPQQHSLPSMLGLLRL